MSYIDRDRLAYFLSKLKLWVQSYAPSKSTATPYADGLMSAADKAKLNGIVVDDAMNAYSVNPVQNRAISLALQGLRDDVDDLAARTSSVYTYKGSVPTYADLPASGNQPGDVYDVLTAPDDGSWVWNGTSWYKMSGFVDLSGLATKDVATPTSDGLMSAADKASFDSLMNGFVPLWSSSVDYPAYSLVRGSDGSLYYSQAPSGPGTSAGAKDPAGGNASYWSEVTPEPAVLQSLAGVRSSDVASGSAFQVPSYVVGSGRLKVFLDGVLCALDESYSESGSDGQYSTSIVFLQTIPTTMDIVVRVS